MVAPLYEALAALFFHPGPTLEADVERATALCDEQHDDAKQALRAFAAALPHGDPRAQQELYLRTFDLQPIASLDIGYTLFGEDYKRGALLANLSREHTRLGVECGLELADHLGNVLRLLPKLEPALAAELVEVLLGPAIEEMLREFEPARIAKKEALYKKHHKTLLEAPGGDHRTAYRALLEALRAVLRRDFTLPVGLPVVDGSKFSDAMGAELRIEDEDSGSPTAPACSPT